MGLEFKLGGINYKCEVDIDDEYVVGVFSVEVWDGGAYLSVDMTDDELEEFYDMYEGALNQAYQDHKTAMAEVAAEDLAELAMDR